MTKRKHALAKCEECPLLTRGKFVPSDGPKDADIAIVGEAPGRDETKRGRPFVGVSGRLLDTVLKHHDIERSNVLLTNVVACRPPSNNEPPAKAIECCSERLKSEVGEASTIVALGNTASSAILGRPTKITKDRIGPAKQSELYPRARVIPTIHPAACLRATDHFPSLVTDIGKVKGRVRVEWEPPKYRVFDKATNAGIALTQLLDGRGYDPITLDLETGYNKDEESNHPKRLRCAGIAYEPGKVAVIGENALDSYKVRQLLAEVVKNKKVICQNGKYDLQVLHNLGIATADLWYDTMLMSYAIEERPRIHSLDYMGQEILGTPNWKGVIKKHGGYDKCPDDVLYRYNAMDCAVTYDVYEWQQDHADSRASSLHEYLVWASNQLMFAESEGIRINGEALDELDTKYSKQLEEIDDQIVEIVNDTLPQDADPDLIRLMDDRFNPNSPTQVKLYLQSIGVPVGSTDADTLEILTRRGRTRRFAELMLEQRSLAKMYGTYVKGYRKRLEDDGRVYTTYALHRTTTGRLSSRNPNVQNVPRGDVMRSVFVPEPGNIFIGADYSNIEGRVVCVLSSSESMRSVFNEGRDIHGEVTEQFYGSDFTKEQRVLGKSVVHGSNYGRGPAGIAKGLGVPLTDAQGVYNAYHNMFPEIKVWQNDIYESVVKNQETLYTPYHRKRHFGLITRDNAEDVYKEALAFQPQSIASDICLTAGIRLREMGIPIRIYIHDGLIAEVPQEDAEDVGKLMETVMIEAGREYTDYVEFPVELDYGYSWAEV